MIQDYRVAQYSATLNEEDCFLCEASSPSEAAKLWCAENWGPDLDFSHNFEVYVLEMKSGQSTAVAIEVIPEPTFSAVPLKVSTCCGSLIAYWRKDCPVCRGMTDEQRAAVIARNEGRALDCRRSE